ncbi:MAG: Gfo/Idh/MocA family protein [Thermoproteota archaeon]
MVVRIGMIGCGGMAQSHMECLAKIPEAKMVAFSDIVEERARSCAKRYSGKAYVDFHRMISEEALDACYICIPPFAHKDQEILCSKNKIPFFVEKPVALKIEKAREVLVSVNRSRIVTQVGYVLRFNDAFQKLRQILHERGGKIGLIEMLRLGGIAGDEHHWWRRKELSGGQLVEQSTHQVDLARWFVGEVSSVYAKFGRQLLKDLPNFTIEDVSTVVMKFKNGAIGTLTSSCAAKEGGGFGGFTILAKNLQILAYRGYRLIEDGKSTEFKETVDPVLEEDKHFIRCVQSGTKTAVPYVEGVRTLEVTLAAVESAKTGREIKLTL